MSRRKTRVAVLFNAPMLPPDHPDSASEADVAEVARVVAEGLVRQGFDAWPVSASPPIGKVLGLLANPRPDVVFNLIEGFGGASLGEVFVTGVLELLGLPYTGCPPEAQALCHSKARTKAMLRGFGLPTSPFVVAGPGEPVPKWDGPWPAMVKPEAEDASLGIDQGSVAGSPEAIVNGVAQLRVSHGGAVLIEAYLPGREFNVGVLALPEPEALPVAEILYEVPDGSWPILTYDAKWAVGSPEDLASRPRCPAEVEPALADRLAVLAVEALRATGCRDYARVDFRLDAGGSPMILEVNPNPDIGPDAGLARAIRASGRDHEATLAGLASQAEIGGPAMPDGELTLRELRASDRPEVARILESSGAFRPEEVAVGLELVNETLNPGPSTDYRWSVAERAVRVVGFACFGPVPMTEGTFDLYWIAVEPESRGTGVAARIDEAVTGAVRDLGGRWLLAETSSTPAYVPAHAFYARQGYRLLGRIEDSYRLGDDRLIFGKRLDQG